MQSKKTTIGILANAANSKFHYDQYFSMLPTGPEPQKAFSRGFFELAAAAQPRPRTVALVAADAEFAQNAVDGARQSIKEVGGFETIFDKSYPPATSDFTPIMRGVQALNPDIVYVAAYPPDSVGIVRAANEIGLRPKMFGGSMIGLTATPIKMQLGALTNGIVINESFMPALDFPGTAEMMRKYQTRAPERGIDPLGYGFAPFAYAAGQLVAKAVEGTKSLDDSKLADYIRATTFKTVLGDVKFGKDGEWAEPRVLQVQFQNVKGNDPMQFKDVSTQVVVAPEAYASGKVIYPYEKAK